MLDSFRSFGWDIFEFIFEISDFRVHPSPVWDLVETHVFVMFVSRGCGSLSFNLRSGPVLSDPGLFPGKFMPWILSCESKLYCAFNHTDCVSASEDWRRMAGFCCVSLILASAALTVCVSVLHFTLLHLENGFNGEVSPVFFVLSSREPSGDTFPALYRTNQVRFHSVTLIALRSLCLISWSCLCSCRGFVSERREVCPISVGTSPVL